MSTDNYDFDMYLSVTKSLRDCGCQVDQPSSKTRVLKDCRSKTHFIYEDVLSYPTAGWWGGKLYPVFTSVSSAMEMVLHPESQPRVGHHPWRALMVAGTSASLPSVKPYMTFEQNDRVRWIANRLLGALSPHEATRSTGQPFAQCASSQLQGPPRDLATPLRPMTERHPYLGIA